MDFWPDRFDPSEARVTVLLRNHPSPSVTVNAQRIGWQGGRLPIFSVKVHHCIDDLLQDYWDSIADIWELFNDFGSVSH